MNETQYLHLHYTSKNLIDSSFSFYTRAQLKYRELESQNLRAKKSLNSIGEDIITGNLNRGTNQLSVSYLDCVKEEIASLLLAKDFLNTTIAAEMMAMARTNHNKLYFHLSLTSVAVLAMLASLFFIFSSPFKYIPEESDAAIIKESPIKIYCLQQNQDKAFNFYSKPCSNL